MKTDIESFSDKYFLLPEVETVDWPRDRIVVPHDLYTQMSRRVRDPVLKLGQGHYRPSAERAVPPEIVAVPEPMAIDQEDHVLLAKSDAVGDFFVEDLSQNSANP